MYADAVNLRRILSDNGMGATGAQTTGAATATATAAAQGGMNIAADIAAILALSTLFGPNPGKENYKKVFKPNADKFVQAFQRDFVTGAAQVGFSAPAIASALSDKLAQQGVLLSPQELLDDATPSTASIATSAGSNIATGVGSFINSLTGGNPTPYIIAGGAGLVLLLLLRK